MARTPQDVTDAELAVLQVLWEQGPATIRHITDVLYPRGGRAHYATVQKLLERLEESAPPCVHRQRTGGDNVYTAAIGRHFGRPGNRFWPALYQGGFTPRLFSPFESAQLLDLHYGITNVVSRATARADELTSDELRAGGKRLAAKVKRWQPTVVAFVGIGPYRIVSGVKDATVGLQQDPFGGRPAWVLPNPSGLNAHYQPAALAKLFSELRLWATAEHERR